jgi:hypothetical protein
VLIGGKAEKWKGVRLGATSGSAQAAPPLAVSHRVFGTPWSNHQRANANQKSGNA